MCERVIPAPRYDLSKYKHVYENRDASIDPRHLFWMYDVLAGGGFQSALEIGCYDGASSTAFVEALNHGLLARATFCDIEFRNSFRATLNECRFPDRAHAYQRRSADLLSEQTEFDFVFVDGDHRLETVQEEVALLLSHSPICVMAHDTNAQATGFAGCDGPPLLKKTFQCTPPYLCLEDNAIRHGEITHRGMFLATTSKEVFELARVSLREWS